METKRAICTICGSPLHDLKEGDHIVTCAYCKNQVILEQAIAFGKVEIDHTKAIRSLRELLLRAIQLNDVKSMILHAQKILEIIPKDYRAFYYYAYAENSLGNHAYLKAFLTLQENLEGTKDEYIEIINHLSEQGDLRDKVLIETYIRNLNLEEKDLYLKSYQKIFVKRKEKEEHYDDIPRDVFICHRSTDVEYAEEIVRILERDGNQCWISTRNLRPNDSENYWDNIEKAIKNCEVFLVASSEEAMLSNDVKKRDIHR